MERAMRLKQHLAWLFAFTDLAFLLLIVLSLVPSAPDDVNVHLCTMDIPSVPANPNLPPVEQSKELWELHVYDAKSDTHPTPFKLVGGAMHKDNQTPSYAQYLHRDELVRRLERLKNRDIRPVLLPSKSSLSHDFLFAAGAIAKAWGTVRGETIVKPMKRDEVNQK